MSNPKEKAEELVNEYLRIEDNTTFYWNAYDDQRMFDDEVLPHAKKCALIAVDEIIKAFYLNIFSDIVGNNVINFSERESNYWEEVKQEIEKL